MHRSGRSPLSDAVKLHHTDADQDASGAAPGKPNAGEPFVESGEDNEGSSEAEFPFDAASRTDCLGSFEDWRAELRALVEYAGYDLPPLAGGSGTAPAQSKGIAVLVNLYQLPDDRCLNDIALIICNEANPSVLGELFSTDDKTRIVEHMRIIAEAEKLNMASSEEREGKEIDASSAEHGGDPREMLFARFLSTAHSRLHFMISMRTGETLRQVAKRLPTLFQHAFVDSWAEWDSESCIPIAQKALEEAKLTESLLRQQEQFKRLKEMLLGDRVSGTTSMLQ